jgi:hypothetical protein
MLDQLHRIDRTIDPDLLVTDQYDEVSRRTEEVRYEFTKAAGEAQGSAEAEAVRNTRRRLAKAEVRQRHGERQAERMPPPEADYEDDYDLPPGAFDDADLYGEPEGDLYEEPEDERLSHRSRLPHRTPPRSSRLTRARR